MLLYSVNPFVKEKEIDIMQFESTNEKALYALLKTMVEALHGLKGVLSGHEMAIKTEVTLRFDNSKKLQRLTQLCEESHYFLTKLEESGTLEVSGNLAPD